ncbi:RagB/SusD family nutrient uptake outer membrane protein [Hymenobacter busanensis]|uniref:RagB/SusD family nutrient uptake outer membrane protein n=1 Tax=Hymenobacter busanensis TaxID=2607656 RepID=A0A7L4ZV79_9BACT|nr:RagB/SusD family nutrient uptake outer membrane protein [Hymenobacter busanensis]KAA9339519.1 RagB/SusD family nutrient uptake outer membrane protein [Hymenobacter busanensis]QHJ06726.1 RagB/SusD family nutrient uptake outer membrane protein [Hymenobacter busanensis]
MKRIYTLALVACSVGALSLTGCEDALDKMNLGSTTEDLIFADSALAQMNIDYIYDQNLPSWGPTNTIANINLSNLSDESAGESKFFEGTLQVNDVTDFGTGLNVTNNYGKLRTINMFLEAVDRGTIPNEQSKKRLKGQAYFFRAWRYFDLVRMYGGVPLVLSSLNAVGPEARDKAYLPRNTTTETFAQIVSDLDAAIASLPTKWTNNADWGRVTKGAAAALKARALLYAASPQFNPTDDAAKWTAAYNASKEAQILCTAGGYALHASFDQLWFQEVGNKEAVFITGFNNSTGDQTRKPNTFDNAARPFVNGTGGGSHQPTWEMVKAFPMKDGKKPGESTKYPYTDQLFYKNRDPRFDKTIAYNGVTWPLNGNTSYKLWTYYNGNTSVEGSKPSNTGFYTRKAIDPNVAAGSAQFVGTDWMEIRYAEVLLNLAESAAGANDLATAYTQLRAIRQRAGIESTGDYGLQPGMSRAEMLEAILYERQIEFAFEGKRFWDLRRWKKFESVLNGKRRTGVTLTLKTTGVPANFATTRDGLNLDQVYTDYLTLTFKNLDTKYAINWRPEYYYFPIPQTAIDNNPSMIQNMGWPNGSFDPIR